MTARGKFITIEGGEGAGKTTHARALADLLRQRGREVILTREPGGGGLGAEQIRLLLLDLANRWDGMSELFLFLAARRPHVELLEEAIKGGAWVVCDRFVDSSVAYQGYGRGLGPAIVDELNHRVCGPTWPDLTLILDVDVGTGLRRAIARGVVSRLDRENVDFHERVRRGFQLIAEMNPMRCVRLDASRAPDQVFADIRAAAEARGFL